MPEALNMVDSSGVFMGILCVDTNKGATYTPSMPKDKEKTISLANHIQRTSGFDSFEEETLLNLMLTYKTLKGELDRFFKVNDISGPQFESLKIIGDHGKKGIPIRKIAVLMVSPQPDISRIVDRLEGSKLVQRVRGNKDRRVVYVRITGEGKRFLNKIMKPLTELHKAHFTHLKKTEIKLLNTLLLKARLPK